MLCKLVNLILDDTDAVIESIILADGVYDLNTNFSSIREKDQLWNKVRKILYGFT